MKEPIKIWAVLFWLLVWQCTSTMINSTIILVSPLLVLETLSHLIVTLDFWCSIVSSLTRISMGFFFALSTGVLLAFLSACYRPIRALIAPAMLTIKSVPVASFIILVLTCFPSQYLATIISFLIVLPVIYTNILQGIGETDTQLLEMSQIFCISPWRQLRYIYLPQIFPYLQSSCAISLGMAWKSGIAAEVIGMPDGSIGEQLQQAKVYLNTPDIFAWTMVIVVISMICEKITIVLLAHLKAYTERM